VQVEIVAVKPCRLKKASLGGLAVAVLLKSAKYGVAKIGSDWFYLMDHLCPGHITSGRLLCRSERHASWNWTDEEELVTKYCRSLRET